MSGPVKRNENADNDSTSLAKKLKQNENDNILMMDHEGLAKILKYLSKDELLKVIEDDERLLPIARCVFKQKFDHWIEVTNEYEPDRQEMSASIKLLKYFGVVIRKLEIVYKDEYRSFDHIIDEAVVEHCYKTLGEIKIVNANRFSMFKINKAFEKVTNLELFNGNICTAATDIPKYFPNLVRLDLIDLKSENVLYKKMLGSFCPKLKSLELAHIGTTDGSDFSWKIAEFIALNPQLENLEIHDREKNDLLFWQISEKAPSLPKLKLCLFDRCFSSKPIPLHFEQLKELKVINLYDKLEIVVDKVDVLIVRFGTITENWLKSIENNNVAISIFLDGPWKNNQVSGKFVEKVKICMELRQLLCDKLTVEQIVDLATHLKHLETFCIQGFDEDKVQMDRALELMNAASITKWKLGPFNDECSFVFESSTFVDYFVFEKE